MELYKYNLTYLQFARKYQGLIIKNLNIYMKKPKSMNDINIIFLNFFIISLHFHKIFIHHKKQKTKTKSYNEFPLPINVIQVTYDLVSKKKWNP